MELCPQCNGDGYVSTMLYDGREWHETCRMCNGEGAVEVPEEEES